MLEEATKTITQRYYLESIVIATGPVLIIIFLIKTIIAMKQEMKFPKFVSGDKTFRETVVGIFHGVAVPVPVYIVGIIALLALLALATWTTVTYAKDLKYVTKKEFCSFIGTMDRKTSSSDKNWPIIAFVDSSTGEIREIKIREIEVMEEGEKYEIIYLPNTKRGYSIRTIGD